MRLLAIDPGASVTGWALYHLDASSPRLQFDELVRNALGASGTLEFKAYPAARKDALACAIRRAVLELEGRLCLVEGYTAVLERPAWAGTYHRRRSIQSAAGIHIVLGLWTGILATALATRVELHEAAKVTKGHRQLVVAAALDRRPTAELDPNEVDAIYLGAHYVHHKMSGSAS